MYPTLFRLPDGFPLLGGQEITSFGLFMFLAFLTAGVALKAEMEKAGYEGDKAWDFIFMAVIGGIIGAKVYYVFLNYPTLLNRGIGFFFDRGGMVWYGGFLGGTAMVMWEIKRSKLPLGRFADLMAPPIAIAYAVGRIGCFMVGDDYGRATSLPWGIRFPQGQPPTTVTNLETRFGVEVDPELIARFGDVVPVHPTQLYEVAISTVIFLVLIRMRPHKHTWGWLFMAWLMMAGAERFFVEIFRAKDDRFFGFLTLAQMISLGLIAVGFVGTRRLTAPAPGRSDAGSSGK